MKILIAGGAGEVGKHLVQDFTAQGHRVRVLDRAEKTEGQRNAIRGDLSDALLVREAVEGMDAVVNLAWSFADDPRVVFGEDIRGHVNLLEAACSHNVSRFIYASTATVYGKAVHHPVTEAHPCLVAEARKPLYALGKVTAEELCRYYFNARGLSTTVLRFWWAYGATIGGSNLRDLIRKAINNQPLEMVPDAGGAFLTMADLARAVELSLSSPAAAGRIYNVGSLFMTWKEIGEIIVGLTGSKSETKTIPSGQWRGPAFLNEVWDLDWTRARQELGYEPAASADAMKAAFRQALTNCVAHVRGEGKAT
jgi:nucleoside-diphosphate-sugar epimerase